MNIYLTKITRATNKTGVTPRISFAAEWLREMGFVPGAAAQFLPESGGCSFVLCGENSTNEMRRAAKEKGGTLVKVRLHRGVPQIILSGFYVSNAGLTQGETLIALYEPGLIRMRKAPGGAVKIVTAHLVGKWLAELGFTHEECFTLAAEPGLITLQLYENGRERTAELVKFARENRLKLLQVQKMRNGARKTNSPYIDLPLVCLNKAGFLPSDAFLAVYEYGLIQLQKLDCRRYGF